MAFVLRWRYEDGSFPQVVYSSGRVNRYPQWIAAVGDEPSFSAGLDPDHVGPPLERERLLRG
jgi:hypothetical protein